MSITIENLVQCVNRDYRAASESISFFPRFIDPSSPLTLPVQFPDGLRTVPTLKGLIAAIDSTAINITINAVDARVALIERSGGDSSSATQLTYDAHGRVVIINATLPAGTRTTTVTYNASGLVASLAASFGGKTRTETYTYNASGQLASIAATET